MPRCRPLFVVLFLCFGTLRCVPVSPAAAFQGEVDVSPDATPQIQQVKPHQAAPGDEVAVVIDGRNFSSGAYVSFSSPAVHVVSTRRASATQLETRLAVGRKARPGTMSLYVSNPASSVAEAPFTIVAAAAPPPVQPAPPAPAPIPGRPAPPAPSAEIEPSQLGTPEVAALDPPRATTGSQVTVKVTGKNFAKGAKVSFSNPGIRVLETTSARTTELTARIQVASDAAPGKTSLYVVNPDDREAEVPFEVASAAGPPVAAPAPAPGASKPDASATERYNVYNLGEGASILQSPNKSKGVLAVAAGKIRYEESGKEVFTAAAGDVKEIDLNVFLGVNTGTFHIILNSGKTYNFVAASLRPADSQAIVDSLRRALH